MKHATFTIATGQVDTRGDILHLEGLLLPEHPVPVTLNFDATKLVGRAQVFVEGGLLKATASFTDDLQQSGAAHGTPAIGFSVGKAEENEHGGRTITEFKVHEVSICAGPNIDPRITSLREQLNA